MTRSGPNGVWTTASSSIARHAANGRIGRPRQLHAQHLRDRQPRSGSCCRSVRARAVGANDVDRRRDDGA